MLNIVTGNLLDASDKYIAHQTNCMSKRAAHLALSVFNRFPYANIYQLRVDGKSDKPGTITISGDGLQERFIINMFGQVYPGKSKFPNSELDGVQARKRYFFLCLKQIAELPSIDSIAFPYRIGCGAAGGNWDEYLQLLEKFATHIKDKASVTIYKLEEDRI